MSRILVLGGTGAMGTYLVPMLTDMGHEIDVAALDGVSSNDPGFSYINVDAKDNGWLREQLKKGYDAIVDFLIYSTSEFSNRYELLLGNTHHYIFFSTYRVYAGASPITESSPRLLDVSGDTAFLATAPTEYSLYKAQQEDILRHSEYENYTIVRPAITFSKRRFQLVTLEADVVVYRAMRQSPVILPEQALAVIGTMNWAGDVAEMLSRLVLNPDAKGQTFTLATAEHHTWREIADYYKEIIGLEYIAVDTQTYLKIMGGSAGARYQLIYDRCFNRIVDNSKILRVTGLKQTDLMPLKEGLARELTSLPKDLVWNQNPINERMDAYLNERGIRR